MRLTAYLEAEQWNMNVKTPMSQSINGYLHNQEKAESSLFSDIPVMKKSSADKLRWQNSFTIFIIQSQIGAIPVFSRLCKTKV